MSILSEWRLFPVLHSATLCPAAPVGGYQAHLGGKIGKTRDLVVRIA